MKILVGTTELEVKECAPLRKPNGALTLRIVVDKATIGFDELSTLLKENTDDIKKLDDTGAVTDIYSGFHYSLTLSYDSTKNVYTAEIVGQSEAEFQNGILKKKIEEQNTVIETLNQTVTAQNKTITAQAEEIALVNDVMLEMLIA